MYGKHIKRINSLETQVKRLEALLLSNAAPEPVEAPTYLTATEEKIIRVLSIGDRMDNDRILAMTGVRSAVSLRALIYSLRRKGATITNDYRKGYIFEGWNIAA